MIPLSILDLAPIVEGETAADALRKSLDLARHAERLGYTRYWVAEHHNMKGIASAATSVVIGHLAGGTSTIRVGAGGIMLPNHSPLVIAEQFGTLEALYPGRIDLGLGRAPGTDQLTVRALRRDWSSAEQFPQDVLELQALLGPVQPEQRIVAVPGADSRVPLWILGSSLYGSQLAAMLGLPYAFASHFAPGALEEAVALYRQDFEPSTQLERPHVIAGVNVVAAEHEDEAREQHRSVVRSRVGRMLGGRRRLDDHELDELVRSAAGQHVADMMRYTAVGGPEEVASYLDGFVERATADELMVVHAAPTTETRLRSLDLVADVWGRQPHAADAGAPA
jgi:luciferase family oxidoreductase group 1